MYIQFYGHSICKKKEKANVETFVDILEKKFISTSDRYGLAMCSEERILYNLKKTKKIDIAIIFHSSPQIYFIPGIFDRDFNKQTSDELLKFTEDSDFLEINNITKNDFINLIELYQKYSITPDLLTNRFYGALIQIDQYCLSKNIKVIHCPYHHKTIPSWFKFKSGIVDYSISYMQYTDTIDLNNGEFLTDDKNCIIPNLYKCSYSKSDNAITSEGNNIIAEKISNYIYQLAAS